MGGGARHPRRVGDTLQKTTIERDASAIVGESATPKASLVVYHRDGGKVVPLAEGVPVIVGRAWPADTVVHDPSLSRQHARFCWKGETITIEDLGSTNGTWIRGERVAKAELRGGDEITLGDVTIAVVFLSAREGSLHALDGHDAFLARLGEEIVRARSFGRPLALLMLRSEAAGDDRSLRFWLPTLRASLRPVDAVGHYGGGALLVALPETDSEAAIARARELIAAVNQAAAPRVVCAVATFPGAAASAEELLSAARNALGDATAAAPLCVAEERQPELIARHGVVVRSARMRALYETVERVARSHIPVLVVGETGTGKEVIARAIHAASARAERPMRCINCAAIPATLLESTLFGHEKGAFTGAERTQKGLFEEAEGGTVFLDEIGELSAAAQAALLRVLETHRLSRVGSSTEITVDVRIVAATHRDLEAMGRVGQFRQDLYYRLATMVLELPPLRERRDEIVPLAQHFLEGTVTQGQARAIGEETRALLERYPWPGNVRELRNVIERAVVIARGASLEPEDLPERVRGGFDRGPAAPSLAPGASANTDPDADFKARIREYEIALIEDGLRRAAGNQTEAARLLRMPLRTLVHKMQTYGIKKRYER